VEGRGGEEDGEGDGLREDGGGQVSLRNIHQHPGEELEPLEGGPVGPEGYLVSGAPRIVVIDRLGEALPGQGLEVEEVDRFGHD
jgi:hypothetical protein